MERKTDQDLVKDGRENTLKDTEDLKVVVPLRDQIVNKLVKKLEELKEGQRTVEIWQQGNDRRADWLERQQVLLENFDEFIEPIYDATNDWSSTLHLPITLTMCKTFHARFLAALLGIDPPFNVRARQSANVDRAALIEQLMRYTLQSWVNNYQGIEDVVDAWLWSWVTSGSGILKSRWDRRYTRYIDVVNKKKVVGSIGVPTQEGIQIVPQEVDEEVEEEVTKEIFNGPMLEFKQNQDVLLVGGGGDPQEADEVIDGSGYYTASQLWSLVDQGIFREEQVKELINSGENRKGDQYNQAINDQQNASSGMSGVDNESDHKRYHVLERYARIDVDGSGIAADVILWVARESGDILRATYLYRQSKTGLRPFFKIDFHKRHGMDVGIGLPELLYTLQREIDAVHNIRLDFGIISSMPFGFFRPTSSLSDERMPLEPGTLIPLDNPQTDVFFPQLGNRTTFTQQEEASLYGYIERMVSISDINLGMTGSQGAARTAYGARALLGESSSNLDVFLRRMNRGWKRAIVYLFHMLQERLPDGFQFRILGDDGSQYWETIDSKDQLCGLYDFEIESNSANSNKQIQIEQSAQILQTIANPLFIQMGMVTPINLYNAVKNLFSAQGIRDYSKYVSKPTNSMRVYTPEELANSALAGVDIPLDPTQDLQGFVGYFEHIMKHDEILGQFSEQQTISLARKAMEAQQMLQAIQAQQAQVQNSQQMQMNASMAAPTPQGAGQSAAQPAPAGEVAG